MNMQTPRCEVCGKEDLMLLVTAHRVCGDCTRKRHREVTRGR